MPEEKQSSNKVAIRLPAKLSIVEDEQETSTVYEAWTRLVSMKGILIEIEANDASSISEGDLGTCSISYKRVLFYSDCEILRNKGGALVLRFINAEFERLMVLKRIIEENE
jgi:hypothetical protein